MDKIETFDWKKTSEKKVFEYEIKYKEDATSVDSLDFPFVNLLLNELIKNKDVYSFKNEKDNKYYAIDTINKTGEYYEIVLKNCKYNFTPNIINVENNTEHESTKSLSEGDKEQTHVLIKGNRVLYENRRNGTPLWVLSLYFNNALNIIKSAIDININKLIFSQILDKNFIETLKRAKRIKSSTFNVKSKLINSDYFNFSEDSEVSDNYRIEIKAKKRKSFNKQYFINKIESLLSNEKVVEKISVDICDENNIPRVINTEQFAKLYKIYVDRKETGEISSENMFLKMKEL